ncbi:zinc finger protein [Macleaya cordata]|uniref:Zinc finger protein n=1 Tax=Macleaya cordata TaxID=56857 RepID=A0A200R835_MACCD|nr:zinc finger protein [Macleaya cordata]
MKEGARSDSPFGRMEKDAVPLSCLIVRKKGDKIGNGGSPLKQGVFENKKEKEKKRPRLILSDTDSDNDLLISPRRKVICGTNQSSNGSVNVVVKNNTLDSFKEMGTTETDRKRNKSEPIKCREDNKFHRNKVLEAGNGGKRSSLDVFEYNEDDLVDNKKMKMGYMDDDDGDDDDGTEMGRSRLLGSKWRELERESSRGIMIDNRRHSNCYRNSSSSFENNKGVDIFDNSRFKMNKDDSFCPVSTPRKKFEASCDEPIRIQGKNGVLKVMVSNKKKVGGSGTTYGHVEAEENRKAYRSAGPSNWKAQLHPSIYGEKKFLQNRRSVVVTEKNQINSKKISSTKNNKSHDFGTGDSETSLPLGSTNLKTNISKKGERNKEDLNLASELCVSTRRKGEVRRGAGTEKQILRDRIRRMLEKAGWTIDYRPRRNRNYHDAVYTNPSGTEYWSILNAYYALQKQCEDEDGDHNNSGTSSLFTPIPEEDLSQLTRQTRKKIEREERKKLKMHKAKETIKKKSSKNKHVKDSMNSNINEDKLNPLIRNSGKLLKVRRKENGFVSRSTKDFGKKQKPSFASNAHWLQGRKSKKQNGCALLVRSSKKGVNADDNDFIPSSGRLTVLSWLIDSGTVSLSEKVKYMNKRRTQTLLEGWITRDGIHCACCSKIVTVSKFEIHSGSKLRQPFQNIYVESGDSLLQCQLDAWNRQEESERSGFCFVDVNGDDPNDDTCGICADGGDLICCDGCPSTFHQSCLNIQVLPPGDWHCSNCSCKFCGLTGSDCQGDDSFISELLTCSLCEEKYHLPCMQQTNAGVIDSNNSCSSFCGPKCRELFEQLQKLLWVKHELEGGFSWTLIQRCDLDSDISPPGLLRKAECNSKLAVALTVMDECFFPIVDRRSGINLIHNVLYNCGSNFNRLNYSGFYTAVLERGDEIISAASIRIHGTRLAEMPFIGTRHIYRRQGMCRRLLNAIESALCSLKVEKLIIPAISELMHAWIKVFGFEALEESHKQEMRSLNMLVFPDTDLLQKLLLNNDFPDDNATDGTAMEAVELKSNDQITFERDKPEPHSSARPGIIVSGEGAQHGHEMNVEVITVQTGSRPPEETDKFPKSAPDTMLLHSSVIHHEKLEVENKLILEPAETDLQSSMEGAAGDVHEVNVTVAGVECHIHSLDNTHDVERKLEEDSHVVSDATHSAETILHASGEGILYDICEVKAEDVAGQTEPDFQVKSGTNGFCNSELPHDLPNFTSVLQNVLPRESNFVTFTVEQNLLASCKGTAHGIPAFKKELAAFESNGHAPDENCILETSVITKSLDKTECDSQVAI